MMNGASHRLLLFGATGAIGSAIADHAIHAEWSVTAVTRGAPPAEQRAGITWISHDPASSDSEPLRAAAPFDAVCWAQGANLADSIADFDADAHLALYTANCLSVLTSLSALVRDKLLTPDGARLCVISSIWQERARQNKLSYTVTKAALGGLIRSASVDLGRDRHLINAVLPGVLDTPMTAANLSAEQLATIRGKTGHHALPTLGSVAELVLFLCSLANDSISGQSIAVDLGMSNASLV